MNKAALEKNKKKILKRYFDEEASLKVIADEFSTYVNCIRRAIIGWGYTVRNRSQAQTAALSSGRHDHPTKGKQHSEQTKIKISEGKVKDWDGLSHAEYQDRVQKAEDQWAAMSPERKEEMARLGGDGIRRASKEGSKAEQELRLALTAAGYDVAFHAKNIIPNAKLEVDLFLPAHNIVIEIDGPAHFFPLWGEQQLQRHVKADTEKLGLVLSYGYAMIRVRQKSRTLSQACTRKMIKETLEILSQVKKKFPPKTERLFEFDI